MGFASSIGDVFSDVTGASQQQGASAKEAKKNRKFQEQMSNTAHYREVKDLRRAGLNPILSANTGASTPSGSAGAMSKADPGSLMSGVSSALQVKSLIKQTKAATKTQITQQALNTATTAKTAAETASILNNVDIKTPMATIMKMVESYLAGPLSTSANDLKTGLNKMRGRRPHKSISRPAKQVGKTRYRTPIKGMPADFFSEKHVPY